MDEKDLKLIRQIVASNGRKYTAGNTDRSRYDQLVDMVNRVILTACRRLPVYPPVYPNEQTFRMFVGMSQRCHSTKSLRDNPLRGSKSREAGSQLRG